VAEAKAALQAKCRRCRHRTVLYPMHLLAQFGADFPVDSLAPKLRCSECGGLGMANVYEISR
jgi:hypothetical protein